MQEASKIGRECDKCDIDKTISDSFLTLNSFDAMLGSFLCQAVRFETHGVRPSSQGPEELVQNGRVA